MCDSVLSIDLLLHDTILVNADSSENIQDGLVHGFKTIDDEGNGDLLPPWDAFFGTTAPVLRLLRLADVANI